MKKKRSHKPTTLNMRVEEELKKAAHKRAIDKNVSLKAVVEKALELWVSGAFEVNESQVSVR